ncbi:DUF975 family protein [Alteribacter aurantiacus]|uniref:DUF975 family protein n=1 Tax=Alteribacter aurantiacus TaxID=254410 RepID=UPI00042307C5|nr:DUF975 family protein [Alteribacter aurantiacus]
MLKIKQLKKQALSSLSGSWGKSIGILFLFFIIGGFVPTFVELALTGDVSQWLAQETAPLWVETIVLLVQIALLPLYFGGFVYFLTLIRQEDASFELAFTGFSKPFYFKVLGTGLLTTLFTALWTLLLIIPGIIKAIAYSQSYYIIRDHPDIKPLEAITRSREMMDGYKWKYFLMLLSFVGWFFVSVFTLGIGFIWLFPYMYATVAAFYVELSSNIDKNAEAV